MLQQSTIIGQPNSLISPKLDIETLVDTKLPPSPGGIMRLTTVLRDFNAPTSRIAEAINYEPSLVTRILRLANSPIYALEKNIATIQQAIGTVGTVVIHDIVMMELTSTTFATAIYNSPNVKKIWKHSLAVALLSRELSKTLKIRGTEEAFICGLLHDIGKIMLLIHDAEGFSTLPEDCSESEMLRSESERYGYNHEEVGALVARRWGLPDEVCLSILHHHDPSQSDQPMLVTHIVDVADTIANIRGVGVRSENESKLTHSESVMKLGFTEEQMEDAWNIVQENLNEVVKAFV